MKTSVLLLTALFSTGTLALSHEMKDEFGVVWCIDRKMSLDERQLKCLQSLDETQIVKQGFAKILQRRRTCSKCNASVIDEEKYLSFYHLPFLVIAVTFVTRGTGIRVHLIFKVGPPQKFETLLVVNDQNVNEFRVIQTLPTSKKMVGVIQKLRGKDFAQYWIEPSR